MEHAIVAEGGRHESTMAKTRGRFGVNTPADYTRLVGVPFSQLRRQELEQLRGPHLARKLHEVRNCIDSGMQLLVQGVTHEWLACEFLGRRNVGGEIPTLRGALHAGKRRELSRAGARRQARCQALRPAEQQVEQADHEVRLGHGSIATHLPPAGPRAEQSARCGTLGRQVRQRKHSPHSVGRPARLIIRAPGCRRREQPRVRLRKAEPFPDRRNDAVQPATRSPRNVAGVLRGRLVEPHVRSAISWRVMRTAPGRVGRGAGHAAAYVNIPPPHPNLLRPVLGCIEIDRDE